MPKIKNDNPIIEIDCFYAEDTGNTVIFIWRKDSSWKMISRPGTFPSTVMTARIMEIQSKHWPYYHFSFLPHSGAPGWMCNIKERTPHLLTNGVQK